MDNAMDNCHFNNLQWMATCTCTCVCVRSLNSIYCYRHHGNTARFIRRSCNPNTEVQSMYNMYMCVVCFLCIYFDVYSGTSLLWTPLGQVKLRSVLIIVFIEVSLFQSVLIREVPLYMYMYM